MFDKSQRIELEIFYSPLYLLQTSNWLNKQAGRVSALATDYITYIVVSNGPCCPYKYILSGNICENLINTNFARLLTYKKINIVAHSLPTHFRYAYWGSTPQSFVQKKSVMTVLVFKMTIVAQ